MARGCSALRWALFLGAVAATAVPLRAAAVARTVTSAAALNVTGYVVLKDKAVPLNADPENPGTFTGTSSVTVPAGGVKTVTTATSGKLVGATGTTTPATSKNAAAVTEAEADTTWAVKAGVAGSVLLTTAGSYAVVYGVAPNPSIAVTKITDPAYYTGVAGHELELDYGFSDPSDPAPLTLTATPDALVTVTMNAGTDIPGLASLFALTVTLNGNTGGPALAQFTSNPELGLDDASVTATLNAALASGFDPATETDTLQPIQFATLTVDVPDDQDTVGISWNEEADATTVPEPGTAFLLLIGGAFTAAARRRASGPSGGRQG